MKINNKKRQEPLLKMKTIDLYFNQPLADDVVMYADDMPYMYLRRLIKFGKYKVIKARQTYGMDKNDKVIMRYIWNKCKVIKCPR